MTLTRMVVLVATACAPLGASGGWSAGTDQGQASCPCHLAGSWPQFRGPNASGVAVGDQALPAEIGPDTNVVWKTPLPPGHSSPVVVGNRVFLTAADGEKLLTVGLDRDNGEVLWQQEAPYEQLERIHSIGSYAQPSAAADDEVVVAFFGSSGLFCYDHDGELLWSRPLGPFKNTYGSGGSPILVEGRVFLNQDHDLDSFLIAVDKNTGQTVWKAERPEFPRGFTTPVVWDNSGHRQVVVAGALRVVGYDFDSGEEIWSAGGMARIATMSPVVGDDGTLFVAEWAPGGDETDRISAEPVDEFFSRFDQDQSDTIELDELPAGPFRIRFPQIDRNKDEQITRAEYDWMCEIFNTAQNTVIAIKPGGRGDVTATHVAWIQRKYLPYVPSPVQYSGVLFMIKNGGILSSRDAETGELIKLGRVPHTGQYYSSPVAGDGKLYLLSQQGELTVLSAESQWQVLHTARFDEEAFATPALIDGRIYLRTAGHLYCFGRK